MMSLVDTIEDAEPDRFFPARASRAICPIGFAINSAQRGSNSKRCRSRREKIKPWRFSNVGLLDLAPFKISPPLSEDDRDNVLKYSRGLDAVRGSDDFRQRSTDRARRRF